jgi:hypothetical protein
MDVIFHPGLLCQVSIGRLTGSKCFYRHPDPLGTHFGTLSQRR